MCKLISSKMFKCIRNIEMLVKKITVAKTGNWSHIINNQKCEGLWAWAEKMKG